MSKKMYMLTRVFEKPCSHKGIRRIQKKGNMPELTEFVDIKFEPKKIVEIDSDIDMSHVVESGFIVEIRPIIKDVNIDVVNKVEDLEKAIEEDNEYKEDKPIKVDVGIITETIDPVEDEIFNTDDDDVVNIINKNIENDMKYELVDDVDVENTDSDNKYEKMEDGKFKCLYCEEIGVQKIFKTEGRLMNHINKAH